MLVSEVMTWGAEAIRPNETVAVAALRMKSLGVGVLVVHDGERMLGVLTDRDIVVRVVAEGRDPLEVDVRSTMTSHVIDCRDTDDLEVAVRRMEGGAIRRIVVVDASGELLGLLSADDVALRSAPLAGEIVEHAVAPGRPIQRGPWPWWEEPAP